MKAGRGPDQMQRFRYDFYGPGTYLAKSKVPLEPPIPASVWPRPPVLTGYVLIQIPPSLTGRVGVLGTPAPPKVLAEVKFGSVVRMARALDCCGAGNRPSDCCAHSGLDPEPRTCQGPGVLPPSPRPYVDRVVEPPGLSPGGGALLARIQHHIGPTLVLTSGETADIQAILARPPIAWRPEPALGVSCGLQCECGGPCALVSGHPGTITHCECGGDDPGQPGTCPA
jgi:hypothetical protein